MIQVTWSDFKAFVDSNKNVVQVSYCEFPDRYVVWVSWRNETLRVKDLLKECEDGIDFETNYKPIANSPEADRSRTVTCKIGGTLHDRFISFTTASPGSMDNTDYEGNDWGDVVYSLRDANGIPTVSPELATETRISFFPSWDYEIAGGHIDVPMTLAGAPEDENLWEGHVVAAPRIPKAYGGAKQLVCNPRLKWFRGKSLPIDSDLNPKGVSGRENAYAREIILVMKHPAGAQTEFQLRIKLYR